jgi:multicomponent Na+:H+ antiporter subunit E
VPQVIASLAALLAAIWLLLSGYWAHPILVPLGAVSIAFSLWLSLRLGVIRADDRPLRMIAASLRYWPWLLWQIVLSNLHVARQVISPRLAIAPRIVRLPITQQTDIGRATLANSITLTPGTISIHVREREIWFYALDDKGAEDTLSGEMDRKVAGFEAPFR